MQQEIELLSDERCESQDARMTRDDFAHSEREDLVDAYSREVIAAKAKVSPSVVYREVQQPTTSRRGNTPRMQREDRGSGSGSIFTPDRFDLTSSHVGTNTDIEDRKCVEEKLRHEEMEFRQITDAIAQTIMVLEPDGTAIYANQSMLDFSGLTMEALRAADFRTQFFHPEDVERLRDERRQALSKGVPFENEQRARRKDGQYRWFLIHYKPLRNEQGQIIRWYATGTDIEDRKQDEERMRSENLALREEIDRASMFEEIVGSSEPLHTVLRQVARVAPMDSTVLILGETGVVRN